MIYGGTIMNKRKALYTSIILSAMVLLISIIIIPITVKAKDNVKKEKHIISVKIEEGDSLWTIAKQYITSEYKDMDDYIYEIKKVNGLKSDTIHAGCYIIVPRYVEVNPQS